MNLQTKLLRKVSKNNGSTLMEFAVVTGLMAILAVAGMPKLSNVGENAALQKSKNELDKLEVRLSIIIKRKQLQKEGVDFQVKQSIT